MQTASGKLVLPPFAEFGEIDMSTKTTNQTCRNFLVYQPVTFFSMALNRAPFGIANGITIKEEEGTLHM